VSARAAIDGAAKQQLAKGGKRIWVSGNEIKRAKETYGGFIGLWKYRRVVVASVTAGVIALIA